METFNHLFPQTLSSFFNPSHFIPPVAGKTTKKSLVIRKGYQIVNKNLHDIGKRERYSCSVPGITMLMFTYLLFYFVSA